jgi:hypothetical protein
MSHIIQKKWISEEESKKFLLLMKFGLLLKSY